MKWIGGIMAGLGGLIGNVPQYVLILFLLAIGETILDTITGCYCAYKEGHLKSRKVIPGILTKAIQFGQLYGIFLVPFVVSYAMAGVWLWQLMTIPSLIILFVETVSNTENLFRMKEFGGVEFPTWVRSLLDRVSKGLQVAAESQMPTAPPETGKPLIVDPAGERNTKK